MIGLYLDSRTPEQEDRVLTKQMEPVYSRVRAKLGLSTELGVALNPKSCPCCLVMTVHDNPLIYMYGVYGREYAAGRRYELLCDRFGLERVNTAIRNRILRNQLRRGAPQAQEAVAL